VNISAARSAEHTAQQKWQCSLLVACYRDSFCVCHARLDLNVIVEGGAVKELSSKGRLTVSQKTSPVL